MQVDVHKICMHTNIDGHGFSIFRDKISFEIWIIFPFRHYSSFKIVHV